jgi:S-adenosylmethionine decarboxylase
MDFTNINFNVLDDMDGLYLMMDTINKTCNIPVLGHIKHKFTPQGCSIIFLLSCSHASIHTYPELGKCYVDFFHCGQKEEVHKTLEIVANAYRDALGGEYKIGILDRY